MLSKLVYICLGDYNSYTVLLCTCKTKKGANKLVNKLSSEEYGFHKNARVETLPLLAGDFSPREVYKVIDIDTGVVKEEEESIAVGEWPWDYKEYKTVSWSWRVHEWISLGNGTTAVEGTDADLVGKVLSEKPMTDIVMRKAYGGVE